MKNRGFTLVEVLGIIVILSLLAVGTYTVVDGISKRNKTSLYKVQVNSILDGAVNYVTNTRGVPLPNVEVGTSGCKTYNIDKNTTISFEKENVCKLVVKLNAITEEGILTENIQNPLKDKNIDIDSSYVTVTYVSNSTYKTNGGYNAENGKSVKYSGSIRYEYTEVLDE